MHLYFHTSIEMTLHYIKALLRDGDEYPMLEIYDYVMEDCKGYTVMRELMRATVISSAFQRLVNTDGSGYCRLRRGMYQMGGPKKTMEEMPSPHERIVQIVSGTERELVGSFYVNLDQGMGSKTPTEIQKTDREMLDKLGQIKAELTAVHQEFTNEMECGQNQGSGTSMEL